MKRVTGIGGIFFKAKDHHMLRQWYLKHLGIDSIAQGCRVFTRDDETRPESQCPTVWSVFPHNTEYFNPGGASFMINYRVENLYTLLEELKKEGVEVDEKTEESEYGKFGWITDPEGNRIELWEPPETM